MNARRRLMLLLCNMLVLSVVIGGVLTYLLYNAAIDEQKERLIVTAQSQARLIEAVARFDVLHSQQDHPEGATAATLSQLIAAHNNYKGFGKTGEFTLAKREENTIVFLLSHRHHDLDKPEPIPFDSSFAEPMRLALSGQSGTIIGLDYRGAKVLAAYEPVAVLEFGIVAKIDFIEIQEPFINAGMIGGGIALLLIIAGISLFIYISDPVIKDLEDKNNQLQLEIVDRENAEQDLRRVFNLSPDMIGSGNLAGYFNKVNPSFEQILGYKRDELCQKPFLAYVHDEDLEETTKALAESAKGEREVVFTSLNRYKCKDGSYKWIEWRVLAIAQENVFFAVGRDITSRKIIEKELVDAKEEADHANKAKSIFLSRMSHELRTPLNAILGFAQLQERYFDETTTLDLRKSRDHILQGGKHLLGLIDDVLDLVKIEQNEIDMPLKDIDLSAVIKESLNLVRDQAEKNSIALNYEQVDFSVKANSLRLKQVLVNLLTNAIKYNREGGSVTIRAEKVDHEQITVTVEDTGVGIDLKDQEAVFAPFSRLRYATESEIDGSGIGLALTQFIVKQMNGCIGFDSEPEQGTVFWVRLPQGEAVKNEPSLQIEHPTVSIARARTVLYIEDTPASRQLLQMTLEEYPSINVLTASNAEEGIDIAKKAQPDLIFVDINLPGIDGITALKIMKNDPALDDTRMIALSADAMPNQIKTAMDAGFDHYLTKPVDLDKVVKIIEAL